MSNGRAITSTSGFGILADAASLNAATILLIAGFLKLHLVIAVAEVAELRLWFLTALHAAYEVALASWLLSGVERRWSARLACATVGVYAFVAGWLAVTGAKSCDCFGTLAVDPWFVVLLDVALFVPLLLAAIATGSSEPSHKLAAQHFRPFVIALVVLAPSAWLLAGAPLPDAIWRICMRLQGYSIAPQAFIAYMDDRVISLDQRGARHFLRVLNLTNHPVNLVGCRPSSRYLTVSRLPLLIASDRDVTIEIQVDNDAVEGGMFRGWVDLYTDTPGAPVRIWVIASE